MPGKGRGKPLPPAPGGWRPGFLPSEKAKVNSNPKHQMQYAPECIPLAILGGLVYQDHQNAHFLWEREPLGATENQSSPR